jgi:hypothetical protein
MSVGGSPKFIRCSALKIGGSTGAMDKFASKWNCEELSIRYVSGPRNQKISFLQSLPRTLQPSELTTARRNISMSRS